VLETPVRGANLRPASVQFWAARIGVVKKLKRGAAAGGALEDVSMRSENEGDRRFCCLPPSNKLREKID
jgi:hypothetical protein